MSNSKHIVRDVAARAAGGRVAVHPLNAGARRKTVSLGDESGLTSVGVHVNVIEPGQLSTECHAHEIVDEFLYVLSGSATLHLDEDAFVLNAGDFVGLPARGPAHWLENTGSVDFVYLIGGTRPPFDICNYPRLQKRLYVVERPDGRHMEFVNTKDIETR